MRVALLSDIHGNTVAFDAVMTALAEQHVDQIVCLGDVAMFGPRPKEALTRVRELGCPVVMGNTDSWALDPYPHAVRDDQTAMFNAIELWCAEQLDSDDRTFIGTFHPIVEIALDDGISLLCYHGSPRSFNDGIIATTPDDELATMLAGHQATVLAGGHTHTQMLRRFRGALVINPGSVGLPFEIRAPGQPSARPLWAEYAVVEQIDGRIGVTLQRVPVDASQILEMVANSAMPYGAWWSQR